jgi:hypothetical protein
LLQKLKRRRETWCPGKAQESVQDAAGGYFLLWNLKIVNKGLEILVSHGKVMKFLSIV